MSKDKRTPKHRRCDDPECGHKWRPRGKRADCPRCSPWKKKLA